MRHLILSPHLDDAVLSLGGLLAQEASTCTVVTFFAGVPEHPVIRPWDLVCGFRDSAQAMQVRIKENQQALQYLGVPDAQIINLPYLDLQYRPLTGAPLLRAQLLTEVQRVLASFAGNQVRVYAPGLRGHADHALVRSAALAATADVLLYEDLPYAYMLPMQRLAAQISKGARTQARPIALSAEALARKKEAVACYASQMVLGRFFGGPLCKRIEEYARMRGEQFGSRYAEVVHALI